MIVAYVSGHGFGHLTRLCEVLHVVRVREPRVPITVVGKVPRALVERGVRGEVELRPIECDVGLVQRDALAIDEAATAKRCRWFEETWDARVAAETAFLRDTRARVVVGDIPALPFEAAAHASVPSVAHGNFSWDWIYRHLAVRQPALNAAAARAARAYAETDLLLELPFAGDLSVFPRRERIGFVARRPTVGRDDARRRLGLDARPAVLLSFGGVGVPALASAMMRARQDTSLQWIEPSELRTERLDALDLTYPDVVGAVDAVVTKPGYGIVSDAIGAGTRVVYTDRGDFPEYPIMVEQMPKYVASVFLPRRQLLVGSISSAVRDVLALPIPGAPDLAGAERAAERVLAAL
jgi:hypothetical protein